MKTFEVPTVKTYLLVLVMAAALPASVSAQEPPVLPEIPPPTGVPPSIGTEVQAQAPELSRLTAEAPRIDVRRRRDAIMLMESVIATAVRLGAEATAREIQALQPGIQMFTTSAARARGFYLEDYGVIFHVEIPAVRPSAVSLIETLARERRSEDRPTPFTATSSGTVPTPPSSTPPAVLMNPDAAYVQAVKAGLIDAMVDYSKSLDLRSDEWLILAARGDGVPLMPGELFETRTMILRVRGADLTEFLTGRITRDEIRRRVQMREF